jgi:hypothetical protein
MADRERDASMTHPASPLEGGSQHASREIAEGNAVPLLPCPDCQFPRLSLVSDGAIVSVLKCPRCGHLAAPLKSA